MRGLLPLLFLGLTIQLSYQAPRGSGAEEHDSADYDLLRSGADEHDSADYDLLRSGADEHDSADYDLLRSGADEHDSADYDLLRAGGCRRHRTGVYC